MSPWSYGLRDELLELSYNFFSNEVTEANELELPSIISLQKQVVFFDVGRLVTIVLPKGNFKQFLLIFLDGILIGSEKGGVFLSYSKFAYAYCEGNTLTFLRKQKGWCEKKGIRIVAEWLNAKVGEFFMACREKALPWLDTLRKSQTRSGYRGPARLNENRLWKKNERVLNKKAVSLFCSKIPASEEEWERMKWLLSESEKRGRAQLTKLLDLYNGVVQEG